MINKLLNQFHEVNDKYETLIEISEEKFEILKKNNFDRLEIIHKKEKEADFRLRYSQKNLSKILKDVCEERRIFDNGEIPKGELITTLSKHIDEESAEKLKLIRNMLLESQRKLNKVLQENAHFAKIMMGITQTEIEVAMELAEKENKKSGGSSYFINEDI